MGITHYSAACEMVNMASHRKRRGDCKCGLWSVYRHTSAQQMNECERKGPMNGSGSCTNTSPSTITIQVRCGV